MLLLDRQDVVALLPMEECMAVVERAFAAKQDAAAAAVVYERALVSKRGFEVSLSGTAG